MFFFALLSCILYPFLYDSMYQKFRKLDHNKNGSLSVDEFKSIPALRENPLLTRLISIFDLNHGILCPFIHHPMDFLSLFSDNEVDFNEFITGLSIFSSDAPPEKKLRCLTSFFLFFYFSLMSFFSTFPLPQYYSMSMMSIGTDSSPTVNYFTF